MADHFEILSRQLNKRLEERRDSLGPQCLSVSKLEAYLTGDLSSDEWEEVKAHLDSCLSCLHAMVELDDLLKGIANPVPPEPELKEAVWGRNKGSAASRIWTTIRGAFEWQAPPTWGFAGALVGIMLTVVFINVTREQAQDMTRPAITLRGIPQATLRGTSPPEIQKVIGVVSTVKEGTEEGIPYHVIRMSGEDGNTYVIFSWGPVSVQANDNIEVDAIVEPQPGGTTEKLYPGVAIRITRLEQTK